MARMPEAAPPLASIARVFGRIGNLTFGGGDAITATLQRELVTRRGWLTFDRYALLAAEVVGLAGGWVTTR
jgi:chromate transport protein ChrA